MMGMNIEHEAIVLDIDLATSTWYDAVMEPHGRQRAVDDLLLGTELIRRQ